MFQVQSGLCPCHYISALTLRHESI
jgi:hypothetical protein